MELLDNIHREYINTINFDNLNNAILNLGLYDLTDVVITSALGGNATANIGFTPLSGVGPGQTTTLGTNVPNAFVNNANVTTRQVINIGTASTGGSSLGNVANSTNLVVVTAQANGAATGAVTGLIHYFVYDTGTQAV